MLSPVPRVAVNRSDAVCGTTALCGEARKSQLVSPVATIDPAMPAAVPFTLVIASNGDVVYQ